MAIKFNRKSGATAFVRKYKLAPLLDKAILGGEEEPWEFKFEPKQGDDAWHPSGDCMPPAIELYHKALNHGEGDDLSRLRKTFMVGHFWHQWLQHVVVTNSWADGYDIERRGAKWWGQAEDVVDDNSGQEPPWYEEVIVDNPDDPHFGWYVKPKPFHWVTGSADVAPCTIPKHGDYVIDFKTMGAHDFKRDNPPEWTADKWECQINIYMDFFGLEKGIVLGILKDSPHEFKEFEYYRNQELIAKIHSKWEYVSQCLEDGTEPEDDVDLPLEGQSV